MFTTSPLSLFVKVGMFYLQTIPTQQIDSNKFEHKLCGFFKKLSANTCLNLVTNQVEDIRGFPQATILEIKPIAFGLYCKETNTLVQTNQSFAIIQKWQKQYHPNLDVIPLYSFMSS